MGHAVSDTDLTCTFAPDTEAFGGGPAEGCAAFECSNCGCAMAFSAEGPSWFDGEPPHRARFRYCPQCGARVVRP